ncbi:MAG: NAD-dependent epimerase/dehydratase family protein [Anaerolineae bacterium]
MSLKVLVTGGAGFIGSNVVDAFLAAGHEVQALDNLSHGKRSNLPASVPLHTIDIRDKSLADLLAQERFDVVSHHAAQIDVRHSVDDPLYDAEVNIMGSLNLIVACRRTGVRKVIYPSSGGAVYGEPQYLPADESHPIDPASPYGVSKHVVEQYLRQTWLTHGLPYTVLRYPNVYGPRQDPLGEAGVISIFAWRMLADEEITIYGTGEQERDFLYVGDCARANVMALSAADGATLNLGTSRGTTINELFRIMAGITGYRRPPLYAPARLGETLRMAVDASKAQAVLGWQPGLALEEGLKRTIASIAAAA